MNLMCMQCPQFIHHHVYLHMYLWLPRAYFAYISTFTAFDWCPFSTPAVVQFLKSAMMYVWETFDNMVLMYISIVIAGAKWVQAAGA